MHAVKVRLHPSLAESVFVDGGIRQPMELEDRHVYLGPVRQLYIRLLGVVRTVEIEHQLDI